MTKKKKEEIKVKKDEKVTAKKVKEETKQKKIEKKFPKTSFIESSSGVFNLPSYVVKGALFSYKDEDLLTRDEAQKKVNNFLSRKVK